jgi:hypothetical protein
MRYSKPLLALLAFAGTLLAADPLVGTWKLNPEKSQYKTGMPPKEQTVTISEQGSELHVMVKGISADGKPISAHYIVPVAGGTGKIVESPYDAVSSKSATPGERENSFSKGGTVVYTTHAKRSADGKALIVAVKGTNPFGQTVDGTSHFEKQ